MGIFSDSLKENKEKQESLITNSIKIIDDMLHNIDILINLLK
jgi:hypothetical protein